MTPCTSTATFLLQLRLCYSRLSGITKETLHQYPKIPPPRDGRQSNVFMLFAWSGLVSLDWGVEASLLLLSGIVNHRPIMWSFPSLWVCSKAVPFHFQTSSEHLLYWHRQSGFQSLSQVKWAYQVFVLIWVWENEIQCYTGLCLKGWLKQSKMCWLRNLSVLYAWVRWYHRQLGADSRLILGWFWCFVRMALWNQPWSAMDCISVAQRP